MKTKTDELPIFIKEEIMNMREDIFYTSYDLAKEAIEKKDAEIETLKEHNKFTQELCDDFHRNCDELAKKCWKYESEISRLTALSEAQTLDIVKLEKKYDELVKGLKTVTKEINAFSVRTKTVEEIETDIQQLLKEKK